MLKFNLYTKMLGRSILAVVCGVMLSLAACSDNDSSAPVPDPVSFAGTLTTTIPVMTAFTPVICDDTARVEWLDADQSSATITLAAFVIETGVEGRNYQIGEMVMENIPCTKDSGDKIVFKNTAFTCHAGDYDVEGCVEGSLQGGVLAFEIVYRPGSMPFDVKSSFLSK